MHVLDLFSGIGGFALGLESVGMRTVAFCECEPYAVAVLRKHWPDTPVYPDVRRLGAATLRRDGIGPIDLICGGFPCQPFSVAGERRGTADERHLWPEFARLIGECRPAWVVAENVPGIRGLAADGVLFDLEALGYACWPVVVGAGHAGAPHRRQRVWFVATDAARMQRLAEFRHEPDRDDAGAVADAWRSGQPSARHDGFDSPAHPTRQADWLGGGREVLADAEVERCDSRCGSGATRHGEAAKCTSDCGWWHAEPDVGRVAHGVPRRVDRLRCLGNAVVPQVVAMIGAWIMQQHQAVAA